MPKIRTVNANIAITDPKAMFNVGHIGATANSFTAINAHVTGAGAGADLGLSDGCLVKNIGSFGMLVAYTGATHGDNTGFLLSANEQIFAENTNLSSISVKNKVASQGITFSVYAN